MGKFGHLVTFSRLEKIGCENLEKPHFSTTFVVKTKRTTMAIIVKLETMMARRGISLNELAERIHITPANLSIIKTGKSRAMRFSTLEALCRELHCQPSDILEYRE